MVRATHLNLGLFDGKFIADRPCEKLFDLVFRDTACAGKCVKCHHNGV